MLLTVRDCCEPHGHVLKDDGRADIEDIALAVRAAEADAEAFFLRNHVTAGMRVLFETGLARLDGRSKQAEFLLAQAMGGGKTHLMVAFALIAKSPADAWQTVTWREGTNAPLSGRFAAVRVRPAHRDVKRSTPRPEEWFMVEWPEGDAEPAKYWLATLPADTPIAELVANAKRRWRIERDYQEFKGEIGLGHYEGRGWRGFHHHATLCIAAYGFLIAERTAFPPSAENATPVKSSDIPANFRPRGSVNPA